MVLPFNQVLVVAVFALLVVILAEELQEEPSKDAKEVKQETDWSVTWLDVLVLGGLSYVGYWFFFRRNNDADDAANSYVIQSTAVPSASSDNKGFVAKMKNSKRRMVAFYGSQTGTAEEYASRLAKEGQMYGMRGVVADPEECDMEDLSQLKEVEKVLSGDCLAVFCMATYGEGDPTDNAQEFFDWLQAGGGDLNGN